MKKKVMCMLLTGVMAAGMFAGCGSSDTADTTTDAAATTDAATTADAADTTSEAAPAENADFDHTSAGWFRHKRSIHRAVRCGRKR